LDDNSPNDSSSLDRRYAALNEGCGMADLSDRGLVEIAGADHVKLLHNFATADVKALADDAGTEAFLLDAKGHVLFYVFLLRRGERTLVQSAPGTAPRLIAHLDRYVIREKVTFRDVAAEYEQLLVAGPQAESILKAVAAGELPSTPWSSSELGFGDVRVTAGRSLWTIAPNWTLFVPKAAGEPLRAALIAAGAVACDAAALAAARIEAGLPVGGVETSEKSLAQELDRIPQTISFKKGCYLGQETVARLDALGHVNKKLVGLRFTGVDRAAVPSSGTELKSGEATVGAITSAAWSPRFAAPVALAYVKTASTRPGTRLASSAGEAEVVALPMG
jgi:tRNA-modifying protein YgfZ